MGNGTRGSVRATAPPAGLLQIKRESRSRTKSRLNILSKGSCAMGYKSVTQPPNKTKGSNPLCGAGQEAYLMANANLVHGKSQ